METDATKPGETQVDSAVQQAVAYGIDVTLLIENLKFSPTDRLRRGERVLRSVISFQEEVERARSRQRAKA